jgi:protein-S-isoprenylcysteine O-methyltransferase Ste14
MSNQIKSLLLPFTVVIVIPAAILWTAGFRVGWGLRLPWNIVTVAIGLILIFGGLSFFYYTIRIFISMGRGTLAPWAPTQKLVVAGPYRYVRNPMITSVLVVLLGESIVVGSLGVFIWFVVVLVVNHAYFIFSEEPGLLKRFGAEYMVYKRNVPRWIPRIKPWTGEDRRAGR